jgi:hypothetical protein
MLRKTIVGLQAHPYFKNIIFVLQEGGDIHAVDALTGEVVVDTCATVQANSSWALDEKNMRMLVCGDMGKAIFFDVNMSAHEMKKIGQTNFPKDQSSWPVLKFWFCAHYIAKSDPYYVSTVRFCQTAGIYITGTSRGEVNLWGGFDCTPLGSLNSKQWPVESISRHLEEWKKQHN